MYYGIKIINPKIFLVTRLSAVQHRILATGSSWSTAGSMGVALMGVGAALGFPPAMTAGAIVSGAYFGDKMSPLSDTTNLGAGNGRRDPVQTHQAHDLHDRHIFDHRVDRIRNHGLYVRFQQ